MFLVEFFNQKEGQEITSDWNSMEGLLFPATHYLHNLLATVWLSHQEYGFGNQMASLDTGSTIFQAIQFQRSQSISLCSQLLCTESLNCLAFSMCLINISYNSIEVSDTKRKTKESTPFPIISQSNSYLQVLQQDSEMAFYNSSHQIKKNVYISNFKILFLRLIKSK